MTMNSNSNNINYNYDEQAKIMLDRFITQLNTPNEKADPDDASADLKYTRALQRNRLLKKGVTMSVDLDYLMPDMTKSIAEGGIRYYKNIYGSNNLEWQNFATLLKHYKISETKPLNKMTKKEMDIILYGSD